MFFSLLTQFTGKVYGTDTAGNFIAVPLNEAGLALVGKNLPEKITFGVINWFFHMVSDIAGSSGTVKSGGLGTGLPGPLVSLLKEISALPFFKKLNSDGNKEFSAWISKLFNGTLLADRDNNKIIRDTVVKFDLRTEIGLLPQLGKQAIPIIINECVVRGFYFIRHLYNEIKNKGVSNLSELRKINFNNVLPFKNRTIVRMLTISIGVFEAVDIADAAIESAIKSGGLTPAFAKNMILKINFVGLGRFALAVGEDIGMGIKLSKISNADRLRVQKMYFQNYCAQLQGIDIKRFREDASQAYEISLSLASAESDIELNNILREEVKKLGIQCPWGERTFDDFMNDKNAVLKF